ncbi:MAG: DUF115 domain-containing protein [Deltaproteobacteria bacterium]|jgi:hypothetical protein|nr:DUF115 domain-containing protein [Deltaproteobacteria bacterium]
MSDNYQTSLSGPGAALGGAAFQVVPGDKGPGLIYRGETIHDPLRPGEEAAELVNRALGRNRRGGTPAVALVFGLGLGWHIRRIKELFPAITVAVYEPDREILDCFEKYNVLSQGQDPKIYLDFERFSAFVAQEVVHGDGSLPLIASLPGYLKAFPKEAGMFTEKTESETARLRVIIKTREATSSAFMDNMVENAGWAAVLPDVMLLKDRFPPFPAFVVGAGPSLSHNGALLRKVGERGLVICAAAALKPLLGLGVSPDVIVVIESSDTSRFLKLAEEEKRVLSKDAVLCLALGSNPGHFEDFGFKKAIFHLNGGEAQLLSRGLFLPQGGNAGSAAFALSYLWGLDPVILVGQDQAYLGSLLHAEGTADSVYETERPDAVKVPGINGSMVETNTSLLASINWFSEAAAIIRRKNKGPRLINASAQGARLQGFDEIPLETLTETIPDRRLPFKLPAVLEKLPRPQASEIRGDLKQMSTLLTQVRHLLHRNPRQALTEMMNISRVSAFMKEILAPALAGGHPGNILQGLSWADGIILKMLSSLERIKKA